MKFQKLKSVPGNVIGIFLIISLMFCSINLTVAYFTRKSEVVNHFSIGSAEIAVMEEFDGTTKSDVRIKNQGNIPVMVRAKVLIYWKDARGNVLLETPGETDYLLTWAEEDTKWELSAEDGFWYYIEPLEAGEATEPIIRKCVDLNSYDDGRNLVVDIVAQSIQEEI